MLFMVIYSSSLILNSVFYNDVFIEVFMTFISFVYIILIISPGLLLFLDYDFINSLINFNVYILGYQWAWNYNILFNNFSFSFDQLILSSLAFSYSSFPMMLSSTLNIANWLTMCLSLGWSYTLYVSSFIISGASSPLSSAFISSLYSPLFANFYMCLFSSYLILSLYSLISFYVHSFDVIHSFGYHSFGFKSDCIPGRVNLVSSLSLFFNGYFISYCYELCGVAHSSMLSSIVVLS